ncbi:MAG: pyridoxine 5'-phosphate synthase [Spartobacteria bacterium]|nr:pyridoxine 5'-phosphate synthase [Spartobacteria bacterium]
MKALVLGVNLDHIATLRQARGTSYPDPVDALPICEKCGVGGITIHVREDRRHMQDTDLFAMGKATSLPMNLEMAAVDSMVQLALQAHPAEVCVVPEKRQELTTEGGLNVADDMERMGRVVRSLSDAGIEVSLFIDPDLRQIEAAAELGAPVIELHTGSFCDAAEAHREAELQKLISGACRAHELGLQVNTGHGINMQNIDAILRIPYMHTLNIGHSIIARSVFIGLESAICEMQTAMTAYTGGERS